MTGGGRHRATELPTPRRPPPAEAMAVVAAAPEPAGCRPREPRHPAGSTDVGSRVLSERELTRRIPWFSTLLPSPASGRSHDP